MTEITDFETAEALRKEKKFDQAAKQFADLWQNNPDRIIGWRYAFCLRKLGKLDEAEDVVREALEKFPGDKWTESELIWILYDKELKPAKEQSDLGRALQVAQEILSMAPEGLANQLAILAVVQVAKKRGKWSIVLQWADMLTPQDLSLEANNFEGRRGMSQREIWYIARSRALYELKRYKEAREFAQAGLEDLPNEIFLARTAALALGQLGDFACAASEMRKLLSHPRSDWYIKADLAELEFQSGNRTEAYRLICEAASNPQGDQFKLGSFETIAKIALALEQPEVAAEHIALAKAIRVEQGWSTIPASLFRLEKETRSVFKDQGKEWPNLPENARQLSNICRKRWQAGSAFGLERVQGTVKKYLPEKKFTFIARDDGGEDVFVLLRDLPRECAREGERVEFALKKSFDRKKGRESFQAVDVRSSK